MISCKDYVKIKKELNKKRIADLSGVPRLAVIQIDDNPASNSYIKGKKADCEDVGVILEHHKFNSNETSQASLEDFIRQLSNRLNINGIIIQLPIPSKYNLNDLLKCISPDKDVDGFRRDSKFKSCTPKGIIDWLDYNNYQFEGKHAVVLGRSDIVGKPFVDMLIDKGCTVTCCNSKTKNYESIFKTANLIISAIGKPKFWTSDSFICGRDTIDCIVDVGINRDDNGKLCGDVYIENAEIDFPNTYITPVPGGVGLLTRMALVDNTVESYLNSINKERLI